MPIRIQRKRTKGWRMPEGAMSVCRPGPFGNPFIVNEIYKPGRSIGMVYTAVPTLEDAIECFRIYAKEKAGFIDMVIAELRGKDLACWCKVGSPCHADVLLEIANS